MATTYYPQPSVVDSLPTPAAPVAITSSTDASPLVVTTATPHGLQTGGAVLIHGHATNTNANGLYIVTPVTSTTFKVSDFSGFPGTFINGSGGGAGSGGTVQSLAIEGYDIPEDSVDGIDAASVNVALEALGDAVAWLAVKSLAFGTVLAGGTFAILAGAAGFVAGQFTFSGSPSEPARLIFGTRSRLNAEVTRLSDADHTVNASNDGPIMVLAKPTAVRTITIEQASDTVKSNGDTLEFYMPVPPTADPATAHWVIKREGSANNIAILWGKYLPTAGAGECYPGFCRVHLEGGVWRLSGGAGVNFDTDA